MSQPPRPPQIGEVSNGHQWNGTQWVPIALPPQVGQVANGHRWDGTQWVPLAAQAPQVGQVANGHQWDGRQWVPLPQVGQVANGHRWDGRQWVPIAPQAPQVGQIANGHQWNGTQWVPLPQVGQVVNGHQWDGTQWVPLGQAPQVGQIANGHRWDGTRWVPLGAAADVPAATAATAAPAATAPAAGGVATQVIAELRRLADAWGFEWSQRGDVITLKRVIAEHSAFMATSRLEYHARVRVDDPRWEVHFTEFLKESGSGLTGGDEDGMSPGFGFQTSSYNTASDGIKEAIEDQVARYGKKFTIDFRYDMVRDQVKSIADIAHYNFRYGPF